MFKVLVDGCEPTMGSKFSACVDLRAGEDVVVGAGETKLVGLGVAIDNVKLTNAVWDLSEDDYRIKGDLTFQEWQEYFRSSHYLQLMLRSSLAAKHGLIIANGVGIVDLDYEDEIKIAIHNPLKMSFNKGIPDQYIYRPYEIKKGDRIAQIMLCEHKTSLFGISTDVKRVGGFGSTGV